MNILTFDEFEEIMNGIEKEIHFQDEVYNAFSELGGEYYRETPSVFSTITLLDKIFEDDSEYPLIDYWVYELDFGKKYNDGCVKDDDGNVVLNTVSDLYDALIKQKATKEV